MATSPRAYESLARTLQQSVNATLHALCRPVRAQATLPVYVSMLQGAAHTSFAIEWLYAWMSLGAPNASLPVPVAGLSANVADLAQLALDIVAAQAGANRVDVLLAAPEHMGGDCGTPVDATQVSRFVDPGTEPQPWFPSASYPVAVHAALVHVLASLVQISAQDSRILVQPVTLSDMHESRIEVYYDAATAPDATPWPAWLGPFVDLQVPLDEFGIGVAQAPMATADCHAKPLLAPLAQATYPTHLRITLQRPRAVDLLSSVPAEDAATPPHVVSGVPVDVLQRFLARRRICVLPAGDDALAVQLRAYVSEWGGKLVELHTRPDVCIVHNDEDALLAARAYAVPTLHLAPLARLAHVVSLPAPELHTTATVSFPLPVGRTRLLYALLCTLFVYRDGEYRARKDGTVLSEAARTPAMGVEEPMPAAAAASAVSPAPISPAAATPDYFTHAVTQLATQTPAGTGLVVHGADGRPAGLYFQPRAEDEAEARAKPKAAPPEPAPEHHKSLVRSGAPTSIQLPSPRMELSQAPRPTPYAHLPSRGMRTKAQPQAGVLIGGRSASNTRSEPATPNLPPLSPHTASQIQRRKLALREEFLPPVKVLIVEDNVINQRILATFLRRKRIKYDVASDGREAVEKWRTGDFHLILMDIQLPVMDGIAATKEIRQLERVAQQSRTPEGSASLPLLAARHSVIIVALTASVLVSDRVAALAAGCNDFLNKPVSLPWLQRKILEWGSMQYLLHAGIGAEQQPPIPPGARSRSHPFDAVVDENARAVASKLRLKAPAERAKSSDPLKDQAPEPPHDASHAPPKPDSS